MRIQFYIFVAMNFKLNELFSQGLRPSSLVLSTQTNSVYNYEYITETHINKSKYLVIPCKI